MSIDKFIMRGMTGSLGSGGDDWITKTVPTTNTVQPINTNQGGGTSFVMGGGGAGRSPRTTSSGREQGGDQGYRSFDAKSIQSNGTVRKAEQGGGSFQARSFSEALSSSKGQRFLLGVLLYGIAIFALLYILFHMFGDGKSDEFYTAPSGLSPKARPLWDR